MIMNTLTLIGLKAQDVALETSLMWLKKHLNYSYPNVDQKKWWLNRFEYNLETQSIHLQNSSVVNPNRFSGKKWLDRTVKLEHLNLNSISIEKVDTHRGRVVIGQLIRIETMNTDKLIIKAIDGRRATPDTFIQISIPAHFIKKSPHLPDSMVFHLKNVIYQSIQYQNKSIEVQDWLKRTFSGAYKSGATTRTFDVLFSNVIRFEDRIDNKLIAFGFIRIEKSSEVLISIINREVSTLERFMVDIKADHISMEGSQTAYLINDLNEFTTSNDGTVKKWERSAFNMNLETTVK